MGTRQARNDNLQRKGAGPAGAPGGAAARVRGNAAARAPGDAPLQGASRPLQGWRKPPPRPRRKMRRVAATTTWPQAIKAALLPVPSARPASTMAGQAKGEAGSAVKGRGRVVGAHGRVPLLASVLVIAAITFGGIQLFTNERFFVYSAEISGNERISRETIYATSGIDQTNIFWIRPGEVIKRLTALPDIAAAQVRVRLPDQVAITVQERVPVVAWQTAISTTWIAADGVPLTAVGAPPALTLVDAGAAAGDSSGGLRPQVLADLLALHTARPDLTNLYYGRQEGLYFRAPEGWTVYLGEGRIADKLVALQTAQREISRLGTSPEAVDLRFEGKVYLR